MQTYLKKHALEILTHILALIPLALLIWDFFQDNLTADPIRAITLRTGIAALILLVLSLACTPVNILFGFKQVIRLRRPLGLYAFLYASLHFLTFIGLDYGFNLDLLQEAIFEKRYALVGFAAFMILLPLAITSTRYWMKRLGKQWKQLHRLVYVAAILAVVHFVWLVKGDIREPLIYGAVVGVLLLLRIPAVRKPIITLRQQKTARARRNTRIPQTTGEETHHPG